MAAPAQDELAALDYLGPIEPAGQAQAQPTPDPLSELEYLSPLDARENPPLVAVDRTGAPLDPAKAGFAPEGTDPLSPANRWNEKSEPFKVTSAGIELDPLRYGAGVQSAYTAGLIDPATFTKLSANAPKIEETARRRRDLEATAGSSPEGKALLYGAGRGGAVTLGFLGGAALPAVAGMAAGPAAIATGTVGGIAGGYAAGRGYDALYKTLAENDSEFSSYLAASQARPGYNAAGELASIAITAPAAPYNLIKGIQLVRETKGALEAAKFAGKVVGLGAGTGAATDITWKLADQAFASGDETPEGPSFQSSFQSAVMGALLSGLTVQNKRYEMGDIQALVSKKQAGESLSPMDEEAVSTALRVTDAVRGEYGPEARGTMRMQGTSFLGKPEAMKAEVGLREGGNLRPETGNLNAPTGSAAAPADLGELIPIEDAPAGAFTMDRNNAVPANVPDGVIEMPGRAALPEPSANQTSITPTTPAIDGNPSISQVNQPESAAKSQASESKSQVPVDDLANLEPITGYTNPELTGGIPIRYTEARLNVSDIKLSEDVPNFKENADPNTGVVQGQQLGGEIDWRSFGALSIWQRNNGDYELISGRHRFDLAKRNGIQKVPVFIMRESDGFSKVAAMATDAELNILDEKGEVKDYANYFRSTTITEDQAKKRGLIRRAKGYSGYRIGTGAGPDLYAAYQAGRINEARTLAIASAAPGDVELQRAGIAAALRKVPADEITGLLGYIRVAKNLEAQGTQGDLFGTSDAALQKGEEIAKAAASKVREINEQIAAVQSAAKRPAAAAKLGVNVSDPEGILNRVAELQALAGRYKTFYTDPEIMAELSGVSPEQAAAEMAPPAPAPITNTRGKGVQYHGSKSDLPELYEGYYNPENIYGGQDTFYTTDALDVAMGYGRKKPTASVYKTEEVSPVKFYDMERGFPKDHWDSALKADHDELTNVAIEEATNNGRKLANLREVMDEMRKWSAGYEVTKDEVQDKFDTIIISLMGEGYGGMTHIGGLKTNREPHIVKIYFNPKEQLRFSKVAPPSAPTIATNGEGNLFAPSDVPFSLTGEATTEPTPAEIAEAERQRLAQEEADAAQGDMFSGGFSGTADYGPQGAATKSAPAADSSIPKDATVMSRGPGWEMPEVLGATDRVLPVEMPELIRWFREATGASPEVRRRMKSLGLFYPVGKGRIALRASLFANPQSVAMTLAHEIGHWIDYLPDESLKRGNILGRLATLRKFLSSTIPLDPSVGGRDLKQIKKEAMRKIGPMPPIHQKELLKEWNQEVSQLYKKMVKEAISGGELAYSGSGPYKPNVRDELIALSEWWKPFIESTDPDSSYYKYRTSSVELYADAISVLFNSPADLEQRAPTFWKAFFNYADRKPEVAEAIAGIQTFLAKGPEAVNRTRLSESKAGYAKASEMVKRRSAAMKAWAKSPYRLWERAKDSYYFYAQPAIELMHQKRRSGQPLKPEDRMDWLFEEMPLANSSVQADLMEISAKVSPILQSVGLTDDDLGIYLENYRIANERIEVERQVAKASEQESEIEVTGRTVMANPDGKDPSIAQALLDQQRADMSPEQWSALQQAAEAFHDKIFSVLSEAVDAGIISREIYETLLVPNKDVYATFTPLKYADRYVPAGIVKQIGTLDQVANPYTQSVLKMAAMRRAAQSNKAKATFFAWMKENFSGLIQDAEMRWDGRRNVPVPTREVGWKTLTYRVDGKLRGIHLPERYADVFESMSPAHQDGLMQALSFLWNSAAYPLIIKYNPSFQLALSPMRDLLRTMRNAPDKTRGKILGQSAYQLALAMLQPQGREALSTTAGGVLGTAVGSTIGFVGGPAAAVAAGQVGSYVGSAIGMALGKMLAAIPVNIGSSPLVNRISGQADDLLIEMLQNGAMVGPHESFYATADSHGALGDILRQYNMLPAEDQPAWSRKWFVKPVLSYLRSIQFAGQIMEALPKVSAYKVLAKDLGWPSREAAAYVRNYMGVPNYMKKGNSISTPGILFPFINITTRSWESSMKLLAGREKGRKSQADYLLSYLFFGGFLTTVMTVLAREGFFGEEMAGIFRKIPDRDVYAYHSIPVGTTTTGDYGSKTAYLRWPVDEVDRAINGMVYYGLTATLRSMKGEKTGLGVGQIAAVPAGDLPSLNPFVSLPAKWAAYATGMNPIDEHRGRAILTDDEMKAGGFPAIKKLVIHSLDKMGVSNFLRYDEKSNTTSEFAISSTAPINRFLKITDAGETERDRDEVAGEEKAIAQVRVDLSEDVRAATREYSWLQKLAERRTPQQTVRFAVLKQWYNQIYRPQIEAMRSSVEKGDINSGARAVRTINGITDGMKPAWAKKR